MSGWLYLIRNRDLYKIGITKNFDNRMRQLKPDNVVAKLYSSDFAKLEKKLHVMLRVCLFHIELLKKTLHF